MTTRRTLIRRALLACSIALLWAVALPAREPQLVISGTAGNAALQGHLEADSRLAYRTAASWFGRDLDGEITVVWVERGEEPSLLGRDLIGSVAGLAEPSRRRVLLFAQALQARPYRLRSVLVHEFCHLLCAEVTARAEVAPPRWLDEGIAMWVSGEWDLGLEWRANHAALIADAATAGTLLSLRELDGGFPSGPFFHLAYAQSLSFVEFLLGREGEEGLRRLLLALDADLDPDVALGRVYGLSLDEAEKEWRDTLGRRGWLRWLPSERVLWGFAWTSLSLLVIVGFVRYRLRLRRLPDGHEEPE